MNAVASTRWVSIHGYDKYNKVECEFDQAQHVTRMSLITQNSLNHFGSEMLAALTFGLIRVDFGCSCTPINIHITENDLTQAITVAGGIENFLNTLEHSIFTPSVEEHEIELDENTVELRVKACVELLVVKGINADLHLT